MKFHSLLFLSLFVLFVCKPNKSEVSTILNQEPTQKHVSNGEKLILTAESHLKKPYLTHSLDIGNTEKLIVRMDGFDCTTLVETVLAQVNQADNYEAHVQKTRYRNGSIEDFGSRIHYFTEWIYENQKNGIVEDVTSKSACSKPFPILINFMTKHRDKYPQLKSDKIFEKIQLMEKKINAYKWNYIPKKNLKSCEKDIQHGDIIAITSNVPGLDIAHLGFAYRTEKSLHLLHASTDEKKVVITKKTLLEYLLSNPKQTGIMIIRAKDLQ